jgi:hypothetical protein
VTAAVAEEFVEEELRDAWFEMLMAEQLPEASHVP